MTDEGAPRGDQHDDRGGVEVVTEVEGLIQAGEFQRAWEVLRAAERSGLSKSADLEEVTRRLTVRGRVAGPAMAFEEAREQEDWVAARHHARRAAELADGEEVAAFLEAAEACARNVRRAWRIGQVEVDVPAEDAVGDAVGEIDYTGWPTWRLTDDGATLVLCSPHGRWLFLREVSVADRRVRRMGWLRSFESIGRYPTIQVDGDRVWVVSESGRLLELTRHPLDIVRSVSLRTFMLPDRSVGDAFVATPSRFVWGELKEDDAEQAVSVVDLKAWRVERRPAVDYFMPVSGSSPPQILGRRWQPDEVQLYTERGEPIPWTPPGDVMVEAAVAHPRGVGWILLVGIPPDDADDGASGCLGLVEMREGASPSVPLIVEDSYDEARTSLAVSRDARLVFLFTFIGDQAALFAFRSGLEGLEKVWEVPVSRNASLVQDAGGRSVALLTGTPAGLDFAVLGRSPPRMSTPLSDDQLFCPRPLSVVGRAEEEERLLFAKHGSPRDPGARERWTEKHRRRFRRDPVALARLADALRDCRRRDLAGDIVTFGLQRHADHPRLRLSQACIEAEGGAWEEARAILEGIDPGRLGSAHVRRRDHLLAGALLRAGDAAGALELLTRSEPGKWSDERAWLDLHTARALLESEESDESDEREEPTDASPAAYGGRLVRSVVRACRKAEACLAKNELAGVVQSLETPVVRARVELQSAARLASAYLALDVQDSRDVFRKATALARLAEAQEHDNTEISGLGWSRDRVAEVTARARDWLDAFHAQEAEPVRSILGGDEGSVPASSSSTDSEEHHRTTDPRAPASHTLPPIGHEAARTLVPGLDACVRETVAYVRALPEWDDTQVLGEDLTDLSPVRAFLRQFRDRSRVPVLHRHLDYCINVELHRRKLFFADTSLAWMLRQTNLDIEGRALRVPFPCFGLVFEDPSTLALAEAVLEEAPTVEVVDADRGVRVLTVYAIREPALAGRRAVRLHLVFDARDGSEPQVIRQQLDFADEDDLAGILGARPPELRELLHLIVNAVLYSTSAGVPWPVARAPASRLRARSKGRGKAKKARVARQIDDMKGQYSGEDVFYLPGRIPISQLRALQQTEERAPGGTLMARFMVRGHWRRAATGWRDQRLRWIEPYWKGPELAAIIEKEYTLKI